MRAHARSLELGRGLRGRGAGAGRHRCAASPRRSRRRVSATDAFYPCYGLAEGTLIASGGLREAPPVIGSFDALQLESHHALVTAEDATQARTLVGAGTSLPLHEVLIVDPESRRRCLPLEVGEVWLRGPSVAGGYWGRADKTEASFHARLSDGSSTTHLRTGDLGFLDERGELFITGRRDDLIIIRGQNHYPQDIERTVEAMAPAVRAGCVAAFTITQGDEQRLVVVAEVELRHIADRRKAAGASPSAALPPRGPDRREEHVETLGWELAQGELDARELITEIRTSISSSHAVQVSAVVLIKAGSISKTTSGKIQRRACRAEYLERRLEIVAADDWITPPAAVPR